MLGKILSGKSLTRGRGLALISAFSGSILLAGCGAVPSSVSNTDALPLSGSGPKISGLAFGGRQPIANATILLCEAGNTGYGSGACNTTSNVAMTTTGPGGTFTMPGYTCPTNTGLLYLKAIGGTTVTGGSNNSNSVLMAAIGACDPTTTPTLGVDINEVTTVASVYALAQFLNPTTETIGSSPGNVSVGLTNAFATVNNLAYVTSAVAAAAYPPTPPRSARPSTSTLRADPAVFRAPAFRLLQMRRRSTPSPIFCRLASTIVGRIQSVLHSSAMSVAVLRIRCRRFIPWPPIQPIG